jgi:quercetin dioxygenase-like cupin family protein
VIKLAFKNIFDNQKFLLDNPAKDLIYKSSSFKIMRISLKKGLVIPSHQGNHVVVFFVLKGKGLFISGSGEVELGENDYITIDENEPRGIRSLEDLVVLAIRD